MKTVIANELANANGGRRWWRRVRCCCEPMQLDKGVSENMSASEIHPLPDCACVHHDAHECARIRDTRHDDDFDDVHRRACECSCHKDDDYYEDDL
jgi:hypothetical protein